MYIVYLMWGRHVPGPRGLTYSTPIQAQFEKWDFMTRPENHSLLWRLCRANMLSHFGVFQGVLSGFIPNLSEEKSQICPDPRSKPV